MLTAKPYALLYKYKHSAKFERFAECGLYNSKRQARWELAYFLLVGRSVGYMYLIMFIYWLSGCVLHIP